MSATYMSKWSLTLAIKGLTFLGSISVSSLNEKTFHSLCGSLQPALNIMAFVLFIFRFHKRTMSTSTVERVYRITMPYKNDSNLTVQNL